MSQRVKSGDQEDNPRYAGKCKDINEKTHDQCMIDNETWTSTT